MTIRKTLFIAAAITMSTCAFAGGAWAQYVPPIIVQTPQLPPQQLTQPNQLGLKPITNPALKDLPSAPTPVKPQPAAPAAAAPR